MNPTITLEREILFSGKERPELQRVDGYAVSLFTGPRRKIAEAILELSEDDPTSPVEDGILSAKCGLTLGALFKELDGCYLLPPAGFEAKVQALRLERKYSERAKLLERELRNYQATGTWDQEAQALLSIIDREIEELAKGPAKADPAQFLKLGSELQALEIQTTYVVDQLMPEQSVTVLHASGGTGKTFAALQVAKSIDEGSAVFGLSAIRRPVIFVDFENPLPVLVERARALDIRGVSFWHQAFDPKPPKLDGAGFEAYTRLPTGSVLIFDTLRASHDKDENSSEDMAPIMARLKELRDQGRTVLVLHHTSKMNERGSKGSTAITDLADHVLALYRVRQGTYQQIEDDGEPGPETIYRLGTGDKTRYRPAQVYLQRSPFGGFVLAEDPNQERMSEILSFMRQATEPITQSTISEWAKDGLGIANKGKIVALLLHGEGRLWRSRKEGVRRFYEPL
jgi:hypothetical protein